MVFGVYRSFVFLKNINVTTLRLHCLRSTGYRSLLSSAYQCTDVWNRRLEGPLFKGIDLDDFFDELDKKFLAKKKVAAVDVDLFINCINSPERFEELEHILYLFRRTRSTVRTLDSTHHGVVRLLVKYGQYDRLLHILSDRIKYGIFPDNYAFNIAMDSLIQKNNFKDASRVAAIWMLQEDLSNPISCTLALYACHMHLKTENPDPWQESTPVPENEDEEEVLVRVPYLRNPHFDDHFDLTCREHLLGKTLYLTAKTMNDIVGRSYMAVGLALHEKWPKLQALLDQFQQNKESILKESTSIIQKLMKSASSFEQSENKENTKQEESKPQTTTEAASSAPTPDIDNALQNIVNKLTSMDKDGLLVDGSLDELVSKKVTSLANMEVEDIKTMNSLFSEWEKNCHLELKREMTLVSLKEAQLEVDAKKKEVEQKEQLLFFFENEDKHMLELSEIKEESEQTSSLTVEEEEYIVPDMPTNTKYQVYNTTKSKESSFAS